MLEPCSGPGRLGKTSLLLKLRHTFRDKYAFAFVDLQAIEGAQADECFNYIAEQMVEQLAETIQGAVTVPAGNTTFSTFLREFARQARNVRIIVILDEFGALPSETAIKLASTIRAVFTSRFIKPEFARYIFLLAGATDMLELTTGRNSPLGNVTERIIPRRSFLGGNGTVADRSIRAHASAAFYGNRPPASCLGEWPSLLDSVASGETGDTGCQVPTDELIRNIVEHLLQTEDRNLPYLIRSLSSDNALWISGRVITRRDPAQLQPR